MYPASEALNIGEFPEVLRGGKGTLSITVSGELESPQPLTEVGPIRSEAPGGARCGQLLHSTHEGELHSLLGPVKWAFLGPMERNQDVRLALTHPAVGSITFAPWQNFGLLNIS